MILYQKVDVKQLHELGRKYPWEKPVRCPVCRGARLWGHGFARRYFEPFEKPFWVKRCRCPDCGSVHTFRPHSYLKTFRYPLPAILLCLLAKAIMNRWVRELCRQLQQGWWRSLRKTASCGANITLEGMCSLVIGLFFWFVLHDVLLL